MIHLGSGVADSRRSGKFARLNKTWGRGFVVSRGSNGAPKIDEWALMRA